MMPVRELVILVGGLLLVFALAMLAAANGRHAEASALLRAR